MIIKNGTIISDGKRQQADIRIKDGIITEIGQSLSGSDEVIDAKGCYIFPGFIDGHTHFKLSTGKAVSPDDFYAGTKAAIASGTTTVIDFAHAFHGESLKTALDNWHKMADGQSSCNYGFHMSFTEWNPSLKKEIPLMEEEGVTSFKVYMAYSGLRISNEEILEVLKEVKKIGGVVGCHCEKEETVIAAVKQQKELGHLSPSAHPLSRPAIAEAQAVQEYLDIAKEADVVVNIVHLSSQAGLEVIENARSKGQKVFVETCPQYLLLEDSLYDKDNFEGAKYVCSPPLRKKADEDALWKAVMNGEIDTIATDHCSFNFETQKTLGREDFKKIPGGMPGVENRPELMYTYGVCEGKISLEQMSALLSENAAKQFGMYPQKGSIQPGSDADLVIWNPDSSHTITQSTQYSVVDYAPFEGFHIKGNAQHVILNGEHVVADGKIVKENRGKYVKRGKTLIYV
jgi:dihydropyrimidinase